MNRQGIIFWGGAALALAAGVATLAQAPVTLTMRSGETKQVTLVDLKAGGFEVRVDGGEHMIAKDQVAMVDFGGPASVSAELLGRISANRHLVVYKNGTTELANWVDVGGTSPLILRFDTGSGEREISAADVARIYLLAAPLSPVTPWPGSPTTVGPQPDGSISVVSTEAWTRTGVAVRTGDYLRFSVAGEIRFGGGPDDTCTADGSTAGRGMIARLLPVRTLPIGGLIGRVGNGAAFSIGTAPQAIRMPADGELMLGINDVKFDDNAGSFHVVVTRGR